MMKKIGKVMKDALSNAPTTTSPSPGSAGGIGGPCVVVCEE
jgi:hypothetical protein